MSDRTVPTLLSQSCPQTTAATDDEGRALLMALGFPFPGLAAAAQASEKD